MKRAVRALGIVISVAGIAFVARALATQWPSTSAAISRSHPAWLVAAIVFGFLGMGYIAVAWGAVLRLLGERIGSGLSASLYFRGEVGKYVPGGVWSVLGRGELARRNKISGPVAYASVLLSLAGLYISCAVVAAASLPWGVRRSLAPVAAVVVVAGLLLLHPRVTGMLRRIGERIAKRELSFEIPSWGASVRLVVQYVPAWLLIGTATWAIVRALDLPASWPQVLFATTLSWLIGFLAVVVPGGIGVREAVFVGALPALSLGEAAAAAVLARVLFMLVDGAGALIAWLSSRRVAGRA